MENPGNNWRFLAGNIIYFYGPFSMAMINNQRVINIMNIYSFSSHA
jgi:late competence protein required for DNA uptake (superfamily II DNA/RNA helicase)